MHTPKKADEQNTKYENTIDQGEARSGAWPRGAETARLSAGLGGGGRAWADSCGASPSASWVAGRRGRP